MSCINDREVFDHFYPLLTLFFMPYLLIGTGPTTRHVVAKGKWKSGPKMHMMGGWGGGGTAHPVCG